MRQKVAEYNMNGNTAADVLEAIEELVKLAPSDVGSDQILIEAMLSGEIRALGVLYEDTLSDGSKVYAIQF